MELTKELTITVKLSKDKKYRNIIINIGSESYRLRKAVTKDLFNVRKILNYLSRKHNYEYGNLINHQTIAGVTYYVYEIY